MMLGAVAASESGERVEQLRRELAETASIGDPVEEMLEIAAIVEEALEPSHIYPVVVGGLAVAYWAAGAYVTYDIDVVMPSSDTVNETMAALGFEREDRFWVLPGRKAFFEAPGTYLEPSPEGWTTAELASGRRVRVQAVEEVLLVRLEEFIATGHSDVLQQCLWLRGSTAVDEDKLHRRAAEQNLAASLQALDELADRVKAGDAVPPSWELLELARRLRHRERGDTSGNH
jgi:hypothetical protein